ncbi:MAG: zinc ribbon domain-containing protein [Elusimicrobia bacterium]|nr:zinc ribbon domain-containing protein [Elusimicrobiota bacterium]
MEPAPEDPEPQPDADKCPECGGWIGETSPGEGVCLSCGAKLETEEARKRRLDPSPPAPATVLSCPKCGSSNEAGDDSLFCDQCGASLEGAPALSASPGQPSGERPSDGKCPDCGGPVVEVTRDHAVCRRCGARLVTPGVRSRRRWGFMLMVLCAALWFLFLMVRRSPY